MDAEQGREIDTTTEMMEKLTREAGGGRRKLLPETEIRKEIRKLK